MVKKLKLSPRAKRGFTIVEVSLVLAITGMLAAGLMVGASSSISRQRYNDAINDLVDFFRLSYSEVMNVQNIRTGRSDPAYCSVSSAFDKSGKSVEVQNNAAPGRTNCAIYGKLLTIGELNDGKSISSAIHSYDVVGKVFSPDDYADDSAALSSDKAALKEVGANAVTFATNSSSQCVLAPAGSATTYNPLWGVKLETTASTSTLFRGAILIFRSPLSGTIETYYISYSKTSELPIDISSAIDKFSPLKGACSKSVISSSAAQAQANKYLAAILESSSLITNTSSGSDYLTLCAASNDLAQTGSRRRGIRIRKGGHNATAVELLNTDVLQDGGPNPCK